MGEATNEPKVESLNISAVIITKNEEEMIANCIASLSFVSEVVVVDSGSNDNTNAIALREGAKVIKAPKGNFATWRNIGLQEATGDWILYIDADERVTPKLAKEITTTLRFTSNSAFALRRNNIHFGKWMEHGGWETDVIVRLFRKEKLKRFEGEVHEHAIVDGPVAQLTEPLVHLTHRGLEDGLMKSVVWTDIEARLLLEAHTPKVKPFTLIRKPLMELIRRLILKKGYKDGMEGWVESFQQAMNRFLVYGRLWELQQQPSIPEKYQRLEKEINRLWQSERRK